MGILTRILEKRLSVSSGDGWGSIFGSGLSTFAGVDVTQDRAMQFSAVYACTRVLAEGIAQLPLLTYEYRADGGRDRANAHPVYWLLKELPNPEQTSFELRELLVTHVVNWGNAYCEIVWGNDGYPVELWPLNPSKMAVRREGGVLWYYYTMPDGQTHRLPAYKILHIRNMGGNGVVGWSVVRLAMQAIGLGLGVEEYGARFFGNGARPGVVLKYPGKVTPEMKKSLSESWSEDHQGLSNAHRVKVLEEGLDFDTIGIPPEEAQFLQTRKFQVTEICRWYRVPPHMIAELDRATFNNSEDQTTQFLTYTLQPWLVRMEQAYARDLFLDDEHRQFFVEHLVDGLLRANTEVRYAAHSTAINNGFMSPNEARLRENLNPYEGGDDFWRPLNVAEVGAPVGDGVRAASNQLERRADDDEDPTIKRNRESRQKLARTYVSLLEDAAGRLVRRECNDLRRAVEKHLRKRSIESFRQFMEDFFDELEPVIADGYQSVMAAYAEQIAAAVAGELDRDDPGVPDEIREFIDAYLEQSARRHVAASRNQIDEVISNAIDAGEDPADLIDERLEAWEESRPGQLALEHGFEANNALAVAFYGYFAVKRLIWAASGDSCPFCTSLSGQTAGIEEYFVLAGTMIDVGGTSLLVRGNKRHGPLHRGCDCITLAG